MYLSWKEAKPVLGHPARAEQKHPLPPVRLFWRLSTEKEAPLCMALPRARPDWNLLVNSVDGKDMLHK